MLVAASTVNLSITVLCVWTPVSLSIVRALNVLHVLSITVKYAHSLLYAMYVRLATLWLICRTLVLDALLWLVAWVVLVITSVHSACLDLFSTWLPINAYLVLILARHAYHPHQLPAHLANCHTPRHPPLLNVTYVWCPIVYHVHHPHQLSVYCVLLGTTSTLTQATASMRAQYHLVPVAHPQVFVCCARSGTFCQVSVVWCVSVPLRASFVVSLMYHCVCHALMAIIWILIQPVCHAQVIVKNVMSMDVLHIQ